MTGSHEVEVTLLISEISTRSFALIREEIRLHARVHRKRSHFEQSIDGELFSRKTLKCEKFATHATRTSGLKLKLVFDMRVCAIDRSMEIEVQRNIPGILQIAVLLFASIPDSLATKCECVIVKYNKF